MSSITPPTEPFDDSRAVHAALSKIHAEFGDLSSPKKIFSRLLNVLLDFCEARSGFIATSHTLQGGQVRLVVRSASQNEWQNRSGRIVAEAEVPGGNSLDHLLDGPCIHKQAFILNGFCKDQVGPDFAREHPWLRNYAGIPILMGDRLVGIVGLANRIGGFYDADLEDLGPLISGIGAVILSIGESKKRALAAEELAIIRNQLQSTAEAAQIGYWHADFATDQTTWTDKTYEIYGLDPRQGQLTVEKAIAGYHPDDRQQVADLVERARTEGKPFQFDLRIVRPDKEIRHVRVHGHPELGPDGSISGMSGMLQDITDIRQQQMDLADSEARFRLMAELAPFPVSINSVERGVILYTNERAREMFAVEEGQSGSHLIDSFLVDPERAAEARSLLDRDGRLIDFEIPLQDSNGREFWAAVSMTRITYDGELASYIAVNDIDARKRQELELIDANERLKVASETLEVQMKRTEVANEAKSAFLANMSHEIRTPMNGVMGMLEVLLKSRLTPVQHDQAVTALESAQNLLKILNNILDISKLEAGQLELEDAPLSPDQILDDVISLFSPTAREKGVALVGNSDPGTPAWVRGDATRLRQVLSNLVGNAVKFTQEGSVDVSLESIDQQEDAEPELLFTIKDTGIGLPDDYRDHLFERFRQADSTTTRRFGGTGLGLAIAKQIVDQMRGDIWCDSSSIDGTTFCVRLPLPECAAPDLSYKPAVIEEEPPGPLQTLKILVAEDNKINQQIIEAFLESAGHDCLLVENGTEAVKKARTGDFDLVLMDIQMPVMDGRTATRVIRASTGKESQVPIIALTANAMVGDREQYISDGVNGYVTKPIDARLLMAEIRRLVPQGTQTDTAQVAVRTELGGASLADPMSRVTEVLDHSRNTLLNLLDQLNEDDSEVYEIISEDDSDELVECDSESAALRDLLDHLPGGDGASK